MDCGFTPAQEALRAEIRRWLDTHLPPAERDTSRRVFASVADEFAYLTAWRRGAVSALEWRDVDLRARTLQLRAASAKNKRAKLIPLGGDLLALLERQAADRRPDCPHVFHRDGRPFGGHDRGMHVAMADGSVRFIRSSIEPRKLAAAITIAGGESFDLD